MAKKKGNKKQQEKKVGTKRGTIAEFKIGDGHEDQPYQKGTMQDVGRDFYDEYGMMSIPPKITSKLVKITEIGLILMLLAAAGIAVASIV